MRCSRSAANLYRGHSPGPASVPARAPCFAVLAAWPPAPDAAPPPAGVAVPGAGPPLAGLPASDARPSVPTKVFCSGLALLEPVAEPGLLLVLIVAYEPGLSHCPAGEERWQRSEERRVGKECRSRWSP